MRKIILGLLTFFPFVGFSQNYFIKHDPELMKIKCPTQHIEFSDLDNDGDEDLFGIDKYTGQFLIYPNTSGTSIDTTAITIDGSFSDFMLVDWNNDNLPDVLTEYSGGVTLLLNSGALSFQSPVLLASGLTSGSIDMRTYAKLGDFNTDGYIDFAFNDAPVTFFLNQTGTAAVTTNVSNITLINTYYDVADIDMDGNLEIYEGQYSVEDIKVYEASGGYTFTYVSTIDLPAAFPDVWEIKHADLNNDGIQELIAKTDWDLAILQHTTGLSFTNVYNGDYTFQENDMGVSSHVEFISAIVDVDNNGFKDIVVGNSVFNNASFVFTENQITTNYNYNNPLFTVGDADNNGMNELWWNHNEFYNAGLTRVYSTEYNGSGYNTRVQRLNFFPLLNYDGNKAIGDFDGDGDIDIAYHSSRNMIICENTGGDNFVQRVSYATSGVTFSRFFYCVDMNNDGLMDILDYDLCCSPVNIKYKKNLGGFVFQDMGTVLSYGVTSNFLIKADADFNGDGFPDLIAIADNGSTNSYIDYIQNSGGTSFAATQIIYTLNPSSINSNNVVDISDADGDGMLDISVVFENDFSTPTFRLAVLEYNGSGFTQHLAANITANASGARFVDLNSDGLKDIVYRKSTNLTWHKNNGGGSYAAAATFQANPGYAGGLALDINYDGLTDLAGTEAILFNGIVFTNYTGTNAFSGFYWDYSKDYDGDGDMDIMSPSSLNYYENVAVSPNKILAKAFYDNNTNGVQDAGDFVVNNFPLKVVELGTNGTTNASGEVLIPAGGNTGAFTVVSNSPYNGDFTFTGTYPATCTLSTVAPVDTAIVGFYMTGGATVLLDQTLSNHRCNEQGRLYVSTTNVSPLETDQTITINLAANTSYLASSIVPTSVTAGQVVFNVNDIAPFEIEHLWIDIQLPPTSSMGDTMQFIAGVQAFDGASTMINTDSLLLPVTCAYDPNDKNITLDNYVMQGNNTYVFGNTVEYLVRFQNTGNDTAATVVIRDNLDAYLDFNSVEAISGSHDFSLTTDPTGLVTVTFTDIDLPDSSVNFLGSMGYIKFRVGIKGTTPDNKKVSNQARIYFDMNPPIYTNTYDFYTMSCKFLANPVRITSGIICANTTQKYECDDYGLPVEYYWEFDGSFAGVDSLESFFIPTTGAHSIYLSIDLPICTYDTTITMNVSSSAVNLVLSVTVDTTTICPYQNLGVSANYAAIWYQNGVLSSSSSYSYSAAPGYLYTASFTIGGCTATKEFYVDSVNASLWITLNGLSPSPIGSMTVCSSTLELMASTPNTYWNISDDVGNFIDPTTQSLVYGIDPTASQVYVEAYFDTLGCNYYEYSTVNIQDPPDMISSVDDTALCVLFNETANCSMYTSPGIYDNFYIYLDGVPVDTVPYPYSLYVIDQPGTYAIYAAYGTCISDTVTHIISNETGILPDVISTGDSLLTGNGLDYNWYYSPSGSSYSLINYSSFISNPSNGYYYYMYNSSCPSYSDTVAFFITGNGIEKPIDVNAYLDNAGLVLSGADVGLIEQIELYDYAGKMVERVRPTVNRIPLDLTTGVYILRIHTQSGITVKRLFR